MLEVASRKMLEEASRKMLTKKCWQHFRKNVDEKNFWQHFLENVGITSKTFDEKMLTPLLKNVDEKMLVKF
jgi:hypothetical protein